MIHFTKMQGLGNDFVVIDAINQVIALTAEQIRFMSDRHFGIGFDQLLLVESPVSANADFKYRIFNADGSEIYRGHQEDRSRDFHRTSCRSEEGFPDRNRFGLEPGVGKSGT